MAKGDFGNKRNTNGFNKNPDNINKKGRPKKTISVINNELEKDGYIEVSKQDIISCYLRLVQIPIPEIEMIVKDSTQPALIITVGKAILSGKGFDVIERILDRGIGKVTQEIEHSGEIKTTEPKINLLVDGKTFNLKEKSKDK